MGSKKNFGMLGFVAPVRQSDSSMLFVDIRVLKDSYNNREINAGLGFRFIHGQWIYGFYGFFDRRESRYHHYFSEAALGVEALNPIWEGRLNLYVPMSKRKRIQSSKNKNYFKSGAQSVARTVAYEIPMAGFDIEAGRQIVNKLKLFGTYYFFKGKGTPQMHGVRARIAYQVTETITVEAQTQYDTIRRRNHLIGLRLTLPFGADDDAPRLSDLEKMMTQPIVRDLDVVTHETGQEKPSKKVVLFTPDADGKNLADSDLADESRFTHVYVEKNGDLIKKSAFKTGATTDNAPVVSGRRPVMMTFRPAPPAPPLPTISSPPSPSTPVPASAPAEFVSSTVHVSQPDAQTTTEPTAHDGAQVTGGDQTALASEATKEIEPSDNGTQPGQIVSDKEKAALEARRADNRRIFRAVRIARRPSTPSDPETMAGSRAPEPTPGDSNSSGLASAVPLPIRASAPPQSRIPRAIRPQPSAAAMPPVLTPAATAAPVRPKPVVRSLLPPVNMSHRTKQAIHEAVTGTGRATEDGVKANPPSQELLRRRAVIDKVKPQPVPKAGERSWKP